MNPDERMLLLIAGAGLAAVIVWQVSAPIRNRTTLEVVTGGEPIQAAGYSQVPTPQNLAVGPEYLTYNAPWAFNPSVGNVVPTTSVGQVGQVASNPPNFIDANSDCGCYG